MGRCCKTHNFEGPGPCPLKNGRDFGATSIGKGAGPSWLGWAYSAARPFSLGVLELTGLWTSPQGLGRPQLSTSRSGAETNPSSWAPHMLPKLFYPPGLKHRFFKWLVSSPDQTEPQCLAVDLAVSPKCRSHPIPKPFVMFHARMHAHQMTPEFLQLGQPYGRIGSLGRGLQAVQLVQV